MTNLMKELCGTNNVTSMYSNDANCKNFKVFPPESFGPIPWYQWEMFFDSSRLQFVRAIIKDSMAVHFWNKMSKKQLVKVTSNQPYADIASKYCPIVFSTVIDTF